MFEQLFNERYFLYKIDPCNDGSNEVKWQLIRRFHSFPTEIASVCDYPFIFSKDFSLYLDIDVNSKRFMIRDSYNQDIIYEIPEWLMDFSAEDETFVSLALKFMWINNDTIKVVNSEGIERLIDIKNNFKEIEFNKIPLFENN